jgi:bis(5'-nucleosidyl)-tetraphosphatase
MKDFSFGIIPLRRVEGRWEVLVIQHSAGHWSFPKGHPDLGETEYQTAERELFEETGLSVINFLEVPALSESYSFDDVQKTVKYFLAEVSGDLVLHPDELQDAKWTSIAKSLDVVTFPEAKNLVLKLKSFFL